MSEWFEILSRLGAAAIVGGGIGLNRHLHHKSTGLRTLSLVACGSAGLVLAALHAAGTAPHVDAMSRVIQGLMTGVGFIGAGVIIRNPDGRQDPRPDDGGDGMDDGGARRAVRHRRVEDHCGAVADRGDRAADRRTARALVR